MSSDAFAPVAFPRLRGADTADERERARTRGYADGHAEGYRAATAAVAAARETERAGILAREAVRDHERAAAVATLKSAADALTERMRTLADVAEERVFAAAIELAELILAAEVSRDDDSAAVALRRAMAAADGHRVEEIRLHPDDHARLVREEAAPEGLALAPDPALAPGDAIVIVEDGFIDARIGAALERARRAAGVAS